MYCDFARRTNESKSHIVHTIQVHAIVHAPLPVEVHVLVFKDRTQFRTCDRNDRGNRDTYEDYPRIQDPVNDFHNCFFRKIFLASWGLPRQAPKCAIPVHIPPGRARRLCRTNQRHWSPRTRRPRRAWRMSIIGQGRRGAHSRTRRGEILPRFAFSFPRSWNGFSPKTWEALLLSYHKRWVANEPSILEF